MDIDQNADKIAVPPIGSNGVYGGVYMSKVSVHNGITAVNTRQNKVLLLQQTSAEEDMNAYQTVDGGQDYVIWREDESTLRIFNPKTQYISGVRFSPVAFERYGMFVDGGRRLLNYRIPKNGSTMICEAFTGKAFERYDQYTLLEEAVRQNARFDGFQKFIVVRDPIERFTSIVAHTYRELQSPGRFNRFGLDAETRSFNGIAGKFASRVKFILKHPEFEEDLHLMPQRLIAKRILDSGLGIDAYMDIKDLKAFLLREFNYASPTKSYNGLNTSFSAEDTKAAVEDIDRVLRTESDWYRSKLRREGAGAFSAPRGPLI